MRRKARRVFAAVLLMLPTYAAAGTLPGITGNWGNESGCALGRGGVRENEDMLLLTPSEVETYATHCTFLDVAVSGDQMVATVICGHEGDELITAGMMIIRKRAENPDALLVTDADGSEWGEVLPCK